MEAPRTAASDATPPSAPADMAVVVAKLTAKLKKTADENGKYKNLLKLAKERIQQQENELVELRHAKASLESQLSATQKEQQQQQQQQQDDDTKSTVSLDTHSDVDSLENGRLVRVCQRIKVDNNGKGNNGEIWALFELEQHCSAAGENGTVSNNTSKQWKQFDTEAQLQDYIRCETSGREPLPLPAFSLTPEQSNHMKQHAKQEMTALSEEFRRYRVKAELARKQADAHIRDLQSAQKLSTAQSIEGPESNSDAENASPLRSRANGTAKRSASVKDSKSEVEQLRAELATLEAHWKDVYNTLLAENDALKSSGSENLLASQWRQRYEQSQHEKNELLERLNQSNGVTDAHNYEEKYKDLKESFKLYRKKAKEIFQTSPMATGDPGLTNSTLQDGSADAKLDYLRNLMVNYLTAEPAMQNHMERAIGTLLKFSQEDCARIEQKRQQGTEKENWFY